MKQIIKISLALIVIQVILAEALPTSTKETDQKLISEPPKDIVIDFLFDKYNRIGTNVLLFMGPRLIKLLQDSITIFESKKESGDEKFNAETLKGFNDELELLENRFENWKKDKLDCSLQEDMSTIIAVIIANRDYFIYDEQVDALEKVMREFNIDNEQNARNMFIEINDQLPQLITEFQLGLNTEEKELFERAYLASGSSYSALLAYYQHKYFTVVFGEADCKDAKIKNALEVLSSMVQ